MKSILSAALVSVLSVASLAQSAEVVVFSPRNTAKFRHPEGLKTPGPGLWILNSREWRGHPQQTVIIRSSIGGYVRMQRKGDSRPILVRYETVDFNAYDFGEQIPMSPNEE